jgi:hypothetical protein
MSETSRRAITSTPAPGSALQIRASARRAFLAGGVAAAALMAGAAGANSASAPNPDAELIRVCHQFAEAEFADWYLYVVTSDREIERRLEDKALDWATLHWIEAAPAITLEGLRAKALAFVAWHRDAFDDCVDDRDGHSTLLASLMRDLAAPARAVIVARLVEQYGPLPKDYTADGVWLGAEART